jgi:UDP-N-acetylmuramyl pentapeptide phosphotransferase/UDP-N-acetylglucosamine-1-phosphate transferase
MSVEIQIFVTCLLFSFFTTGLIVLRSHQRSLLGVDSLTGLQKAHQGFVSRIGGLSFFFASIVSLAFFQTAVPTLFVVLIITALPVFLAGVVEDFTGLVSARLRLLVSLISGVLFCWLSGYRITFVDIGIANIFLSIPLISVVLTSVAIASFVNATNIVDGLNGLAATTAIIMTSSFALLAMQSGDAELKMTCVILVASVLGFLIWNFPFGKIFMGDGGAYFLGALVAGIAVLIPERNHEISPFSSLLIIIYPFYELLRSIIRRIIVDGFEAFEPDDQHLHSLVFKAVMRRIRMTKSIQNSLAAMIVLILPLLCCFWAVIFSGEKSILAAGVVGFVLLYEAATAFVGFINTERN